MILTLRCGFQKQCVEINTLRSKEIKTFQAGKKQVLIGIPGFPFEHALLWGLYKVESYLVQLTIM